MAAKNEIIVKAIELFNQCGYTSVTMRDIANAMHKSVGNITYYFQKKSDLISAIGELIYNDFQSLQFQTEVDISGLNRQLEEMIYFQNRYSFYFSNMITLRKYGPSNRQFEVREKLTLHYSRVFRKFEQEGIFKAFPGKESHRYLADGIVLIILSWGQQVTSTEKYEELLKIIWNVLYPNLAQKGAAQLNNKFIY